MRCGSPNAIRRKIWSFERVSNLCVIKRAPLEPPQLLVKEKHREAYETEVADLSKLGTQAGYISNQSEMEVPPIPRPDKGRPFGNGVNSVGGEIDRVSPRPPPRGPSCNPKARRPGLQPHAGESSRDSGLTD